MPRDYVLSALTPDSLQRRFAQGEDAPYVIAARLNGRVETAFPTGPPAAKSKRGAGVQMQDHER